MKITVRLLEFPVFGAETRGLETRGFGNCRIAHVVTLKIVIYKGREFVLNLMLPLVLLRAAATLITIF